ncbi:MAG: hypothetical protein WB770_00910, partial [Acidimicrobiales bacterium]
MQWIDELFTYLESQPEVVGFVWSEYAGRTDWPIETSPASEVAMRPGLAHRSAERPARVEGSSQEFAPPEALKEGHDPLGTVIERGRHHSMTQPMALMSRRDANRVLPGSIGIALLGL